MSIQMYSDLPRVRVRVHMYSDLPRVRVRVHMYSDLPQVLMNRCLVIFSSFHRCEYLHCYRWDLDLLVEFSSDQSSSLQADEKEEGLSIFSRKH